MPLPTYTRREFCVQSCQTLSTLSLAALSIAVTGCSGSPTSPSNVASLPTINSGVANGAIMLAVDASSALATVGGAALVNASGNAYLVARTAQDTFTALTAVCTHEGCTVSGFQSSRYVCPCHGSEFTTSGDVAKGPANRSLRQFTTRFAGNVLTITV